MDTSTQKGFALLIGLIFLLILTILATTGMKMARLELLMAGNEQFFAQAIHAAEAAVEKQIAAGSFLLSHTSSSNNNPVNADTPASISGRSDIFYLDQGPAPDGGYSDDVLTHRFRIQATGVAPAGPTARAEVTLNQGIYILAPGGGP